jgi:hypothetical protein
VAAVLVTDANRIPQLLADYKTTMPLAEHYAVQSLFHVFGLSIDYAAIVLVFGAAWFFLERAFGPGRILAWGGMNALYFRDAFCVVVFGSAAVLGLNRLPALFARWPLLRHALPANVPGDLDVLNPAALSLSSSISAAFFTVAMLGLLAGLIAIYVRAPWMRAGVMILYAVLVTANVATPGAFFRDAAFHLVTIAALWYGVTRIARFNALGYFLLAAMMALVPAAVELLEQPNPYLHANGYAVLAFALAILAWPLLRWQRGAAPP